MKALTNATLSVATFLAMASCAPRKDAQTADTQVIRAVVNQLCKQMGSGYYVLVSSSEAVDPRFTPKTFDDGARKSLLDRNQLSMVLPEVDACDGLKVVKKEEMELYFERQNQYSHRGCDQWCAFYGRFINAQGIMRLSFPGYSMQGDLAVVQVSAACGQVCGSTFFWVLRRKSDGWHIVPNKTVQGPIS